MRIGQSRRHSVWLLLATAAALLLPGCSVQEKDPRLQILQYESEILGKEMISQVYLPEDYDKEGSYPVLYFLPGGGGSSYTVMNQFGIREAYDRLVAAGEIHSMILVAPGIDLSFGMNTAQETGKVTTETELVFNEGRYEDYILLEVIPMVEELFAASGKREERFIGGYSMGGLASLHVAMRNPELFGKAGGHSPTLFLEDDTDLKVQNFLQIRDFLYPTQALHKERNPLYLAESMELTGTAIYLDTGMGDINGRAVKALGTLLEERGVDVQTHFLPGSHSFGYCSAYMEDYLRFYAGLEV